MAIKITDKAIKEINIAIEEEKTSQEITEGKLYVRVKVVGGGCSGFQSKLTIEKEINQKLDESYEINGISLVVDKRSAMYIVDATIDFIDDMNSRGFKIENPQAKSTCGCGSSFSM
jgi:iron-sulfur cluster assembly protein